MPFTAAACCHAPAMGLVEMRLPHMLLAIPRQPSRRHACLSARLTHNTVMSPPVTCCYHLPATATKLPYVTVLWPGLLYIMPHTQGCYNAAGHGMSRPGQACHATHMLSLPQENNGAHGEGVKYTYCLVTICHLLYIQRVCFCHIVFMHMFHVMSHDGLSTHMRDMLMPDDG